MSRRGRTHVKVGDIIWVRHGSDPFWPAIIAESTSATFEVLFIEAQTDERDYQCGTVNRSSLRWSSFNEGLESCRGGEPLYRSWDEIESLLAWIGAKHQSAIPEELLRATWWPQTSEVERATGPANASRPDPRNTTSDTFTDATIAKPTAAIADEARQRQQSDVPQPLNGVDVPPQPKKRRVASNGAGLKVPAPKGLVSDQKATPHCRVSEAKDDLNNSYGAYLLCDNEKAAQIGEFDADPDCNRVVTQLKMSMAGFPYEVAKLAQSGSDAVTYAVSEACGGDFSRCLFAAGTYVVGDNGPLRKFSTSGMNVANGERPAIYRGVLPGDDLVAEECLSQVVPLPYCIPAQISDIELLSLESRSLQHLQARFALNALASKPTRALLLELILASNGAELSIRFMKRLSEVCKSWDVTIVIDEVLTSVRCDGNMLLALSWGLSGCFSHAVIGKWPGIGAVFRIVSWNQDHVAESRGETTCAATWGAFQHVQIFNDNKEKLPGLVANRRKSLCDSLATKASAKLNRERSGQVHTWGRGALVFSNVHALVGAWSSNQDFKLMAGRYLPRIISDSPAVLSEAVRVEVKTNFAQEQTEYVRIMFDEWLAQGERTSGYAQLDLIAKMRVSVSYPLRPWTGVDEAERIVYPGSNQVFDEECLRQFLRSPQCVAFNVASWGLQHPWYQSAKKTAKRKIYHFMLPAVVRYRTFLYEFHQCHPDTLVAQALVTLQSNHDI